MKNFYFSQFRQDEFLNRVVFNNKKHGFFVDIGAHDGQTISNSLYFELNNNWEGVCIEPNPVVFDKLNKNRKSINLNVCVGESNKIVKFTQIQGYSEMLSGVSENYDKKHIKRIDNDLKNKGGIKKEIEVQMVTLDSIDVIKRNLIDFISIDTEGNEFNIISSINFESLEIKAIVVENNYDDIKIKKHLLKNDFELLIKLDVDEVYLNKKYNTFLIKYRLKLWLTKLFLCRFLVKFNYSK